MFHPIRQQPLSNHRCVKGRKNAVNACWTDLSGVYPVGDVPTARWPSAPAGTWPLIHANWENFHAGSADCNNSNHRAWPWEEEARYGFNRFIKLLLSRRMASHFTDDRPAVESNLFCPPCVFRPIRSWNMLSDTRESWTERSGEKKCSRYFLRSDVWYFYVVTVIKRIRYILLWEDFCDKSDFEIN